jgi:hypothetical protein
MLWGGWMLMPARIGTFFEPEDFSRVYDSYQFWIWTFRFYLFGMVITAIALVALASLLAGSPARVMVWPGAAVATAGMFVGAVGAAFYYHHGAWGALDLHGKSAEEVRQFVDALRVDTEYVTCLVRFGRVFSGLGIVLLGCGVIKWNVLPGWIGWVAVGIGLAAMGVTMLMPNDLWLYQPVFHGMALWLLGTGAVILRDGVRVDGPGEADGP